MDVYLNIGLAIPNQPYFLNPNSIVDHIEKVTHAPVKDRVQRLSHTEQTLVLVIRCPLSDEELYELADKYGQDCVAQFDAVNGGKLIGPRAADWGVFNPEFFLLPSGARLGRHSIRNLPPTLGHSLNLPPTLGHSLNRPPTLGQSLNPAIGS